MYQAHPNQGNDYYSPVKICLSAIQAPESIITEANQSISRVRKGGQWPIPTESSHHHPFSKGQSVRMKIVEFSTTSFEDLTGASTNRKTTAYTADVYFNGKPRGPRP